MWLYLILGIAIFGLLFGLTEWIGLSERRD